ncbi:MAG: hypothetical protein LBJ61_12450 [Deltaproteobacteria bacterium]|nr:hypothetical protein [Deltaproteobacteria bacterium]
MKNDKTVKPQVTDSPRYGESVPVSGPSLGARPLRAGGQAPPGGGARALWVGTGKTLDPAADVWPGLERVFCLRSPAFFSNQNLFTRVVFRICPSQRGRMGF